jgi:hypothetical protein
VAILAARTNGARAVKLVGAIVINPRSGEPFLCNVDSTPSADFQIRRFSGENEGIGDFDNDPENKSHIPAEVSGYPRVHIYGVTTKGVGNGTALYVAGACIAAISRFRDDAGSSDKDWPVMTGIQSGSPMPGVSSGSPRSAEANEWWIRATGLGLATAQTFDARVEEDVNRCVDGSKALGAAREFFGIDPDDVSYMEACINGTLTTGSIVKGNILRLEDACAANLVVGLLGSPLSWVAQTAFRYAPSNITWSKRPNWIYFNPEVARAANVGLFRTMQNGQDAFDLWMKLLLTADIRQQDFDAIRDRYAEGYDLQPEAVMGIDDPRKNPSQRTRLDPFAGVVKSYAPARRNPATSSGDATLQRARELAEERRRLGWNRFSRLP